MHVQRKSLGNKILCGTLAFGLVFGSGVSVPAAVHAADAATPKLVTTSGDTWNGTDDVRVYVEGAEGMAVDSTTEFVVNEGSDKYEIVDGYLKLKEGAEATDGDKITIGTTASYYTADQLLWSDGLEKDESLIPSKAGKYGLTHSEVKAHTGLKAGTTAPVANDQDGVWSPAINSEGRLVFWYYDPATEAEMDKDALAARESFDQVKFGMAINNYPDLLFGVGIPASADKNADGEKFADVTERVAYADTYTVRFDGNWNRTNISRTEGWHKMEADVTAEGTRLFIDGKAVCLNGSEEALVVPGVKTINKAAVAVNWATKDEMKEFVQDKHFIDDMYILKTGAGAAKTADVSTTVTVETGATEEPAEMALTFGEDNTGVLAKGESGKVYLDNSEEYAIESVKYTTDNENILVSEDGTLSFKEGYAPKEGETVQVTAEVTYYNEDGVVFADSFEGEKQFTDGDSAALYEHSDKGALYGRHAATAVGTATGSPSKDLEKISDVTVTAWYYDANGGADQTKFGFGINNNDDAPLGIFYDGSIAALVDNMTKTHYGARVKGFTYHNYGWGTTDVERSAGWHKFQWIIDSENGLTEKIDGKVVSTNSIVGDGETDPNLVKVENNDKIKSLNRLAIRENWNNNGTNLGEISHRHFIDGVTVVKNGTATETKTLTSVEIPLTDVTYTVAPETFEVDTTYPEDKTMYISPYLEGDTDVVKVLVDDNELAAEQWSAAKGAAPENALNYPAEMKGYKVTLNAEAFKEMEAGEHSLVLVTTAGSEIPASFTVKATEHVATDYYLSNNTGDDNNDGHTPETAWKSFDKLQQVTFGPGDRIYLDAESTWSGVQFRPNGSGAEGNPIIMTKYNDGGDSSKRPILNGDGTVADLEAHSYAAFDTWRKFYPSGTIELFNVDQWEVRGIEVTNYAKDMVRGATGRNGIAVIHDYMEVQGITPGEAVAMSDSEKEQAFYRARKLQHVVIDDCYIHDVVGFHPANGAVGAGGKMSGGINAYGPYDDLHMDNNIVMYCDVEGIRNDVLAWRGDTRTQFPAYMEDVTANNNYIAGIPGDGIVLSSAVQPEIANNYLTDAGYSYYAGDKKKNVTWGSNVTECRKVSEDTGRDAMDMGNRQNPTTLPTTNFAGLWFIGTKDGVAQYNEAVNNVWTCNDSEAFDADMFCWGTVFQYNYTYRNNGGMLLIMGTADEGTVVRYNVSVEDSQGYGLDGSESQNGLFHYAKAPDAIYNNLFILGKDLSTVFGGGANSTHFFNNIMIAPNGLSKAGDERLDGEVYQYDFHINGSSDGSIKNPPLSGEMYNNLFTPGILDSIVEGSTVDLKDNKVVEVKDLDEVFVNLDGFMDAQPVKALLGRSDFTGDKVENLEFEKGAGVAMSPAAGRSVTTPTGGFDLTQFEGIKLKEGSPAIGAGLAEIPEYNYKAQTDAVLPLTKDFFEQDITGLEKVDIGPFQSEGKEIHKHTLKMIGGYDATCTEEGRHDYFICEGEDGCGLLFWDAEGTEQIVDESEIVIPANGHMEAAEWSKDEDGHWKACTVCGAVTTEKAAHTDADADNFCDVCAYEFNVEHVHNLTKVPAKAATCTENGNIEYYTCECGKWFVDAEGTEEITDKASVVVKATGHTDENKDGKCDDCGKKIEAVTPKPDKPSKPDQNGTIKTGDQANFVVWIALVIAAGAGIISAVSIRKKNIRRKK